MKLKSKMKLVILSMLMLNAPSAFAANPYSDCGIGAAIFKDSNVGAVISNVIWDLGTTAITSAVSSKDTCKQPADKLSAAKFIYESYINIEEDTAKGEGKHLTAMLSILGCESNMQALSSIRKDFASQVSNVNYNQNDKLENSKVYFDSVVTHCDSAA